MRPSPQRWTYQITGQWPKEVGTVTDNRTGETVKQWTNFGPGMITVSIACTHEIRYQMRQYSPSTMEWWRQRRDEV